MTTALEVKKSLQEWRDRDYLDDQIDFHDWFGNANCKDYKDIIVPGLGALKVIEAHTGKEGPIIDSTVPNAMVWEESIIFEVDGQIFRILGEHDSWDPQGWDGEVEEVEQVQKTITVWETKHDY